MQKQKDQLKIYKTFSLLGYPKCGNTWVHHVLWIAFNCEWEDIFHSHAMPDFNRAIWREAQYDFRSHLENKTIIITRHLGDVLVSLWMHLVCRNFPPAFHGEINDIVSDPIYGFMKYLRFHQLLAGLIEDNPENFFIVKYTDLRYDESRFKDIFKFIGFKDEGKVSTAILESRFKRMHELQEKGLYNMATLARPTRSGVTNDSLKVRKGIVGGYFDYFNDKNIEIIHNAMLEIPAIYGFNDDKIYLKRNFS